VAKYNKCADLRRLRRNLYLESTGPISDRTSSNLTMVCSSFLRHFSADAWQISHISFYIIIMHPSSFMSITIFPSLSTLLLPRTFQKSL